MLTEAKVYDQSFSSLRKFGMDGLTWKTSLIIKEFLNEKSRLLGNNWTDSFV